MIDRGDSRPYSVVKQTNGLVVWRRQVASSGDETKARAKESLRLRQRGSKNMSWCANGRVIDNQMEARGPSGTATGRWLGGVIGGRVAVEQTFGPITGTIVENSRAGFGLESPGRMPLGPLTKLQGRWGQASHVTVFVVVRSGHST